MFESAVQDLLRKYLRDYLRVDELALQQIVVSLWGGKLEIEDLELRKDALRNLFGLEVDVEKSKVGKLHVSVPWSSIQSKPVVIELRDIEVIAKGTDTGLGRNSPALKTEEEIAAEKRARLEQLERLESGSDENQYTNENERDSKGQTFMERLGTTVLNNLQLVLKNVHIRFEDPTRVIGVKVSEIALVSTNEKWVETFISQSQSLFKLARMVELRIYCGLINSPQHSQHTVPPYLYSQEKITVKLHLEKDPTTGATKSVNVGFHLGKCAISVQRTQIAALSSSHSPLMLTKPPSPKERWHRAIQQVLQKHREAVQERKRKAWVMARKNFYVSLFKKCLDATASYLPDLTQKEKEELDALEESPKMFFADVVRLRKVAYEEVRIERGDPRINVQQRRKIEKPVKLESEPQQQGWLSSWWYGSKEASPPASTASSHTDENTSLKTIVTEADREELFETIGYDPDVAENQATDFKSVSFNVSATIESMQAVMISEATNTKIGNILLGYMNLQVLFQKEIKNIQALATSLLIEDANTLNLEFPHIVSPADKTSNANLLNLSLSRDKLGKPLSIDVKMEQALRLVYVPSFISAVLDVFTNPLPQQSNQSANNRYPKENGTTNLAASGSTWETYQAAYSQVSVEDIWNEENVPQVSLVFKAPSIVLPEDPTRKNRPFLQIDLGELCLGQEEKLDSHQWFWKVERMSMVLIAPASGMPPVKTNLLSDVSLHSSIKLSNDSADLAVPRVDMNLVVPSIQISVSTTSLNSVNAIVQKILLSTKTADVTEGDSYRTGDSQYLFPEGGLKKELTRHSSSRLAERVSFRLASELKEFKVSLHSDQVAIKFSLAGAKLGYLTRSFDSQVLFSSRSITLTDTKKSRALLVKEGSEDVVRCAVNMMDPLHSPLFEGVERSLEAHIGAVTVLIPQDFVHGAVSLFGELSKDSGTAAASPKSQERNETVSMKVEVQPPKQKVCFTSDSLKVQLADFDENPLALLSCGKISVSLEPRELKANLQSFTLGKGPSNKPLIWPITENIHNPQTIEKLEDLMVFTWKEESGYTIETEALYMVLDEDLYRSLLSFIPKSKKSGSGNHGISSRMRRRSSSTTSTASEVSEKATEQISSSPPTVELKLRNPSKPFIFEFISSASISCYVEFGGLSFSGSGVVLESAKVVLNKTETIGDIRNISYSASGLNISSIDLSIKPTTRRMLETTLGVVSDWLRDQTWLLLDQDANSGGKGGFQLSIESIAVRLEDLNDENGVSLLLDQLTLQNGLVTVRDMSMQLAEDERKVLSRDCISGVDSPILSVSLGDITKITLPDRVKFQLTPTSFSAFNSYISLITLVVGFISNVNVALYGPSEKSATKSNLVELEMDKVAVSIDTNRPKLESVDVSGEKLCLVVDSTGSVTLTVGVELMKTTRFFIEVCLVWDERKNLEIILKLQNSDSTELHLNPLNLYRLNSAFKHNILLPTSELPQYLLPAEGGGGHVSFESRVDTLVAKLISPSAKTMSETESLIKDSTIIEETDELTNQVFSTVVCESFFFRYDGATSQITLTSPKMSMFSALFEADTSKSFMLLDDFKFSLLSFVEGKEMVTTSVDISSSKTKIRYNAKLIQKCLDYIAAIEYHRVENLLAREFEQEGKYVPNRTFTLRFTLESLSLLVEGNPLPSFSDGPDAAQIKSAFVARMGLVGLVDVSYNLNTSDRVIQLNLSRARTSYAFVNQKDLRSIRDFPILDDTEVIIKISSRFSSTGIVISNSYTVMIERVNFSCLIPVVPEMASIVLKTLRERPTSRVVRQTIIDQTDRLRAESQSEIPSEEGKTASYELKVTVDKLDATAFGEQYPAVRLRILNTSTAEGQSQGSASSFMDSAFKGDLDIRNICLQCFNPANLTWEPMLEPCEMGCRIETVPHFSGHAGVKLHFRTSSAVKLNLHPQHFAAITNASNEGKAMLADVFNVLETKQPLVPVSKLASTPFTGSESEGGQHVCYVENFVGFPICCQGVTVPFLASVRVASKKMRVVMQVNEYTREVLLVDGDEHVLDAPFLAIYVERVETAEDSYFRVVAASATSARNMCGLELQVKWSAHALTNNDENGKQTLLSDQNFYVPTNGGEECILWFRLLDSDAWQKVSVPASKTAEGLENKTNLVTFNASQKTIAVSILKVESYPSTRVVFRPVKTMENHLPVGIRCEMLRKDGPNLLLESDFELAPGQKHFVYSAHPEDLSCRFSLCSVPSAHGKPCGFLQTPGTYEYDIHTKEKTQRQQIRLRFSRAAITLFSPFWIVNSTNLALVYGMHDGTPLLGEEIATPHPKKVEETWENQTKTILKGWDSDMPVFSSRQPWSDKEGTCSYPRTRESIKLPPGSPPWEWESEWRVDVRTGVTDSDGWQYATSFLTNDWSKSEGWSDMVRRRRWTRTRIKKSTANQTALDGLDTLREPVSMVGFKDITVSLKPDLNSTPLWSSPLALDIVSGTNNVFPLRRCKNDQSFYELVLSVKTYPAIPETKLCIITPRTILVNQVRSGSVPLRCMQAGSVQNPYEVDATPLHWSQPPRAPLLQLQVDKSNWSAPFSIDGLDRFCIAVSDESRQSGHIRVCVDVKRSATSSGTALVVFTEDDAREPMYRIQNVTLDTLVVQQRGAQNGSKISVSPYSIEGFGWADSTTNPRIVRIGFQGHNELFIDVDITRVEQEKFVRLPPRRLGESNDREAGPRLLKDSRQLLVFASNAFLKWAAVPPKLQVQSLLDDVDLTNAQAAWQVKASKEEGSPVRFVAIDPTDGNLKFGDEVAIYCTSGDGKPRVLEVGDENLYWKLNGSFNELGEFVEDENMPSDYCKFVLVGGQMGECINESTSPFGLSPAADSSMLVTVQKESGFLVLSSVSKSKEQNELFTARHIESLQNLPERIAFINVDIEGKSRTIRVSETSLTGGGAKLDPSSSLTLKGSSDLASLNECDEEQLRLDLTVELSDLNVSFISLKQQKGAEVPFEVAFFTASLEMKVVDTNLTRSLDIFAHSLRIDNDLPGATYLNVVKRSYDPESASKPVVHFKFYEKHTQLNVMYVQHVQLQCVRLDVSLDEPFLDESLKMVNLLFDAIGNGDSQTSSTKGNNPYVLESCDFYSLCEASLRDASAELRMFYIRALQFGSIKLRLSFFKNQFTDIERAPIEFEPLNMKYVTALSHDLSNEVVLFYKAQVQRHILIIIGYLLPGNPGELIRSFGGELSVGGLVKGAVRGFATLGTIGSTLAKIDQDYKKQRAAPQNVSEGFAMGGDHITQGFSKGWDAFVRKPVAGAEKDGIVGAVSGFGSGLLGLVTKPVSGVASAVGVASQGLMASTKSKGELLSERQSMLRSRPPRLFPASNRYRILSEFHLKETIVLRKALAQMSFAPGFDSSMQGKSQELWQSENNGQVYFASFFFTPLPFFLLHTQTSVAFGTYREDDRSVMRSAESSEAESLEQKVIVQLHWVESKFVDSTQPIQQALTVWKTKLRVDSFSSGEGKLRQESKKKMLALQNGPRPVSPDISALASSLKERFSPSFPPRVNMFTLRKTWDALFSQHKDVLSRRKAFGKVILLSEVWTQLPLLTGTLLRAYFFTLENFSSFRVDTAKYTTVLEEFEGAIEWILSDEI